MNVFRLRTLLRCAIVLLAVLGAGHSEAQRHGQRHRHHNNWNNHWHNDWDNRRDARRAGVVAGVVAGGVAGSAARSRADQRYSDCLWATGYSWECDRRRFNDEMRARESARRAGVVAGVATYAIVRR
ncbi:hypothetical protein QTH90_02340 [Variovorax sp. J2P1-59]|uniref:hypothetical protein n=1 Tax=Variovorax flavidus TaxID=3053501 RepID=UPI002579172F|nr:hypothetical protein [Variovorax sp. J2P1-59]MDM0073203.1 hypothetical protein [Variovorax sp. J2P1-59]